MNVALVPKDLFQDAEYFNFPHPRNGKNTTFIRSQNTLYELLRIDRPHSSWLIGNSFVSDGTPYFAVPFHPLLLVLPFVSKRGKQMFTENDFFFDTPYAPIDDLLKPHLKYICQTMELGDDINYNYDQETALNWLISKTERLLPFLQKTNNLVDYLLIEVSYDVLRHYISSDFANLLKECLRQKYPKSFPPQTLNSMDYPYQADKEKPQPPPKKKAPSTKLKKPAGNTDISSFFGPAKPKK